jgi:hypothetical protein
MSIVISRIERVLRMVFNLGYAYLPGVREDKGVNENIVRDI